MAKIIEYPRASLRAALALADAVDSFAGSCSVDLAAEKLGKKGGGAFAAVVGAAGKYKLVESKSGKLWVTSLYRDYKLAYTPDDAAMQLRGAFLSPPLFRSIYERFKGQKLPVGHFEKLLIREFNAPDVLASRLGKYFLEGAKQCGLLAPDNLLKEANQGTGAEIEEEGDEDEVAAETHEPIGVRTQTSPNDFQKQESTAVVLDGYKLNLRGPGLDFSLEIKELDDLDLVQVMIRKIEKALKLRDNVAQL